MTRFIDSGAAVSYEYLINYRTSGGASLQEGFSNRAFTNLSGLFRQGRLKQLSYDAPFFANGGTRGGRSGWSGFAMLDNHDSALDIYANRTVQNEDGGAFLIRDPVTGSSRTDMIGDMVDSVEVTVSDMLVYLRDGYYRLDEPILPNRYAGNNVLPAGLEGTADDLKGKTKPRVIGRWFNWSPPCVNTSRLIYQVNDGPLQTGWSLSFRDKGVAIASGGADYVSQVDMETNAPAAGTVRIWPGGGYARFGSLPEELTCDGVNPVPSSQGSVAGGAPAYVTRCEVHAVAMRLLITYKQGSYASLASVQGPGLAAYPDCGIVLEGETTAAQALNQILSSVGGTWSINGSTIWMFSLPNPSSISSSAPTITDNDMNAKNGKVSLRRVKVGNPEGDIPVWRVVVRYKKNHNVQKGRIAGAVSAANKVLYETEWRTAVAEDSSIKTPYLNAVEIVVDTALEDATAAQTEATRLLGLYGTKRNAYEFDIQLPSSSADDLGFPGYVSTERHNINLVSDRFELSAGKKCFVIGRKVDTSTDTVTVKVWG